MKRLLAVLTILAVAPSRAQETVYVAPAPQPGDPAYISYRLDQLAESLRRSELDAARLEVFQSQAAVNRRLLDKIDREELESLVGLAAALESAGTEDQRRALGVVITSKLEAMLPANLRTYAPGTTLVVAAPGFPWAAEHVAGVLGGKPLSIEATRAEALTLAQKDPNVVGVVEVEVNVYQAYETVRAVCYRPDGGEAWHERRLLNAGGGPEKLARDMVGALLKKVRGRTCP
jgi:hypothetical protein